MNVSELYMITIKSEVLQIVWCQPISGMSTVEVYHRSHTAGGTLTQV